MKCDTIDSEQGGDKSFRLRLPRSVYATLAQIAANNSMSVNTLINTMIIEGVRRRSLPKSIKMLAVAIGDMLVERFSQSHNEGGG